MISVFLAQELASDRLRSTIRELMGRKGIPRHVVAEPDLRSADDNARRRQTSAF
jgi:hypothetical protein